MYTSLMRDLRHKRHKDYSINISGLVMYTSHSGDLSTDIAPPAEQHWMQPCTDPLCAISGTSDMNSTPPANQRWVQHSAQPQVKQGHRTSSRSALDAAMYRSLGAISGTSDMNNTPPADQRWVQHSAQPQVKISAQNRTSSRSALGAAMYRSHQPAL